MSELKTLKEMEILKNEDYDVPTNAIEIIKLRQEAIKWIKEIKRAINYAREKGIMDDHVKSQYRVDKKISQTLGEWFSYYELPALCVLIQIIFNIEQEDLK